MISLSRRAAVARAAIVAVSLLIVVVGGGGFAQAQEPTGDTYAAPWRFKYDIRSEKPLKRKTRRVRIVVSSYHCEPDTDYDVLDHVQVRRRKRSIVITPFLRDTYAPSSSTGICAGVEVPIETTVKLRGRLGRRSILDGTSNPPRKVAAAPKS